MADVQVSNARRIGFTALAIVAFVILTVTSPSISWWELTLFSIDFDPMPYADDGSLLLTWERTLTWLSVPTGSALLPAVFASLSEHNSPFRSRDPWVTGSYALFACTIGISNYVGEIPEVEHSSFWLLPPLLLTMAFVIFGAWRRAVRDSPALR